MNNGKPSARFCINLLNQNRVHRNLYEKHVSDNVNDKKTFNIKVSNST